ncbi:MAG: hypothetical protein WDA11_13480 [Thiohalomonadaceae bacterium]
MTRKDMPKAERRGAERRRMERRTQPAPVFMDTRVPGERRAGERRGPDDNALPLRSGKGRGGNHR